jgi:hypothetical protein
VPSGARQLVQLQTLKKARERSNSLKVGPCVKKLAAVNRPTARVDPPWLKKTRSRNRPGSCGARQFILLLFGSIRCMAAPVSEFTEKKFLSHTRGYSFTRPNRKTGEHQSRAAI